MKTLSIPPLPVARSLTRLGQAISLARRRRHLTQEDLAQRIGASTHTVRRMEAGHPGTAMIHLARALQVFGEALAWHALGEGFTWETQDRERDRQLVQQAWQKSCDYLADGSRKLVVLDEVNVALKLGYLGLDQVLEGLDLRPPLTHVALTGRGAPPGLIERADLVTEMKLVRHPFREQGVKAQAGIEY